MSVDITVAERTRTKDELYKAISQDCGEGWKGSKREEVRGEGK